MKFGVVVFPGSNCDDDMMHVLGRVLGADVRKLWHKDTSLEGFENEDCIVLPGGFSYGDYLRAGAIARYSPIMQSVISFAQQGGKVWGICNGFQVLCESGLLPGALVRNQEQIYFKKHLPEGRNHRIVDHPSMPTRPGIENANRPRRRPLHTGR